MFRHRFAPLLTAVSLITALAGGLAEPAPAQVAATTPILAPLKIVGSGVLKVAVRPMSGVHALLFHGLGTLIIDTATPGGLSMQAESNLLPQIESRVDPDGTLELGPKSGVFLAPTKPVRFRLHVRSLDRILLFGTTMVESPAIATKGMLMISAAGGSRVHLKSVQADTLMIYASDSGQIVLLSGKASSQSINLTGTGLYDAFGVKSKTVHVQAAGSTKTNITVTDQLTAMAAEIATVHYKGDPAKVERITNGQGSVTAAPTNNPASMPTSPAPSP